jgi:hypothetical protein
LALEHQKPCEVKTINEASLGKKELIRKSLGEMNETEKKILLKVNQLNAKLEYIKDKG